MICTRCAEPLVTPVPDELCGFCRGEMREEAIGNLFAPPPRRIFAIWHLRDQGCSAEAVVRGVKAAVGGRSREEVEGLLEVAS